MSESESELMNSAPDRTVLGALVHLSTTTRTDIATAVSMVGKFQEKLVRVHSRLLNQVYIYLIWTILYAFLLPKSEGKCVLDPWSDADWASDLSNRRLRTSYVVTVSGAPILCCSKLHTCTSL